MTRTWRKRLEWIGILALGVIPNAGLVPAAKHGEKWGKHAWRREQEDR